MVPFPLPGQRPAGVIQLHLGVDAVDGHQLSLRLELPGHVADLLPADAPLGIQLPQGGALRLPQPALRLE